MALCNRLGCNLHRNAKTMKLALLALIGAAAAIRAPTRTAALRYRGGTEDDDDSLFGGDDACGNGGVERDAAAAG